MSEGKIAVVTGATGFIANHVIQKLLDKGYTVRGTVRNKAKAEGLTKLFPKLELHDADLLAEGSFDEVVKGATYVFHTASPFPPGNVQDPQKELVDPALKGTLNVLNSIAKDGCKVKRVVLTSSVAAVAGKRPEGHVYTEDDWNLDSTVDFESYRYSKRIAEESAWKFAKEHGLSLVVINPSFVVGPPLMPSEATSILYVKGFLEGKINKAAFGCVDVRDVAEAHVRAAEDEKASGRYMATSTRSISHFELSQMIKKSGRYDAYSIPHEDPHPEIPRLNYSRAKAEKELGITFTPIEKSMVDMADKLVELGVVSKK